MTNFEYSCEQLGVVFYKIKYEKYLTTTWHFFVVMSWNNIITKIYKNENQFETLMKSIVLVYKLQNTQISIQIHLLLLKEQEMLLNWNSDY